MPARLATRLATLAVAGSLTATVTGCSTQWMSMSPPFAAGKTAPTTASTSAGQAAAVPTPAAGLLTPTPTAAPTATRASGDLDAGAAHHKLPVGAADLVVDYWTATDPTKITASSRSVIQLSARLTGASTHETYVSSFSATVDGVEAKRDSGRFVMTPPYSYGSAVVLPELNTTAGTVTVVFTFELLVETAPDSKQFFRQTAVDSLTVAIA